MTIHDVSLFDDPIAASRVARDFSQLAAPEFLRFAIRALYKDRIALVTSFGADSAVLLHMVSEIAPATPVVFVDTQQLFRETLSYRDAMVERLGLTDVRTFYPDPAAVAAQDGDGLLWSRDVDACCNMRKVAPLAEALGYCDAWITGRKKFQSATRAALSLFEAEGARVKLNPLAGWTAADVLAYLDMHDLPRHPLVAQNYTSIGCAPCTSPVQPGEDARAGRWRGRAKTECGIHLGALEAGRDI